MNIYRPYLFKRDTLPQIRKERKGSLSRFERTDRTGTVKPNVCILIMNINFYFLKT